MKIKLWSGNHGLMVLIWMISLLIPLYGKVLDQNIEPGGVLSEIERTEFSFDSLEDGSYQNYLTKNWESAFPGKKALLNDCYKIQKI